MIQFLATDLVIRLHVYLLIEILSQKKNNKKQNK